MFQVERMLRSVTGWELDMRKRPQEFVLLKLYHDHSSHRKEVCAFSVCFQTDLVQYNHPRARLNSGSKNTVLSSSHNDAVVVQQQPTVGPIRMLLDTAHG